MKKIAIIGAGGFGREVKMLIDQINDSQLQYQFMGYYDDGLEQGAIINGAPVLGAVVDLNAIDYDLNIVMAIGMPAAKREILEKIDNDKIKYPVLIHPNVVIGKDNVHIGEGCIICAGTLITIDISIGNHVIFNLGCTVGHDTKIGNFCSFMPSVNVSGEVNIEGGVYVGTGAKIINQLEIGSDTIVGAGAVVYKSLPANCTAIGIPAKPIKFHD